MAVIFGLFDPRKPIWLWEVRYIGQTEKRAEVHLQEYITISRQPNRRPVIKWIKKLMDEGTRPVVRIFEHASDGDIDEREIVWIAEGRRQGWRLLNVNAGGRGNRGYKHSEESKAKISAAGMGRKMPPRSDEWRRKRSEALRGKKQSPELIEKRAAGQRGQKRSPETRAKIGEANRRRVVTEETKRRISASKTGVPNPKGSIAQRGKKLTPEHRRRISESVKANPATGEAKERQIQAAKQRPSEETKLKMSEARRAWWERKRLEDQNTDK